MEILPRKQLLYTVLCLDIFAGTLIIPVLPPYLRSIGVSHTIIGVLMSLHLALQLFFTPVAKNCFVEHRKDVLQITLLVCTLTYALLGSANVVFFVFIYRIAQAIFAQTQTVCGPMLAEILPPHEKAELQKFLMSVGTTSLIVAASIAGHTLELRNGFRYVCSFISITQLINYAIVYFFLQNPTPVTKEKTESGTDQRRTSGSKGKEAKKDKKGSKEVDAKQSIQSVLLKNVESVTELKYVNWKSYWDVYALQFLFDFAQTVHFQNFAPVLRDVYNTAPRWIGYTVAIQVVAITVFGFLGEWINRLYRHDTNHVQKTYHGFGIYALSFFCLSFAPSWNYIFICLLPLSASISLLRNATLDLIKQRTQRDKNLRVKDAEKSVSSAARLIAPLVLGVVYEYYGFPGTSILKVVVAVMAALIAANLLNHRPKGRDAKKTN